MDGKKEVSEKHTTPEINPSHGTQGQGTVTDTTVEKNGIKLHPQPTSDPLDPLNWSRLQKHTILGIVMFK